MEDLKSDVAGLVADVAAYLHALSDTAAQSVFEGPMEGLPSAVAPANTPSWVPPTRGLDNASPGEASRRALPPPPSSHPTTPRAPVPASFTPPPRALPTAPLSAPTPAGAAVPAPGVALFGGKWAAVLKDPAEDLRALWSQLAATCDTCNAPPPRGAGSVRARLAVVATPMSGESDAMLQRMFVHVLAMERGDAFVIAPGTCAACAELARKQVAIVQPRAVLVMGEAAARVTRVPYGKWGRWSDLDALATHHPDAIVAKPELKAPVFEHLKEVARRV